MSQALKEKPKEYALEYAGFWLRLAAALIDFSVLIAGLYILYCVISQSLFWIFPDIRSVFNRLIDVSQGEPISGSTIWVMATIMLTFLVGGTIYCVACNATLGQTLGKMSVGIKVIRTDSSPLDIRFAILRFLGSLLCIAMLGIGFILIAFDSHKQGLHDRIADTYVVKLPVKQVVYSQTLARGEVG